MELSSKIVYGVARTPQQNGVAKRRNKTLIEAARTMLVNSKLPTTFWAEVVNIACYVLNRVLVIKPHNKTPYELIRGRTLLIDFMKPFGCPVTILNTKDHLGKFDGKVDKGFFVGYSVVSKDIRVFNKRTKIVEETLNIRFLENTPNVIGNGLDWIFDVDSLTISMNYVPVVAGNQTNGIAGTRDNIVTDVPNVFFIDDTGIFGNAYDDEDVGAEADLNNLETTMNVSPILTTRIDKDHPKNQIIGDLTLAIQTRRMTKISDEHAMLNRSNARGASTISTSEGLDTGYTQEEGIDYDEIFALVARIEAIRLFLAYASFMEFIVYQMDVKSALLYGTIEEEKEDGIFISQDKYMAEILKKIDFATVKTAITPMEPNKALVKDDEADSVDVHLYRSMIRLLMYLTASRPDITFAVCACARFQVTPKTSHLHAVNRIFRYFKGQPKLGLWYPKDSPFNLEAFSDSDYAGASLDRKSTARDYVAAANCCGQVLWIQNQMLDYGFNFMNTKIYIDNESIICIVKNPVLHSKTKHIDIKHHFIRDSYEKRLIHVLKIHIDHNVADLLTKGFDVSSGLYTSAIWIEFGRIGWCCSQVFKDGFDGSIGLKMLFGPVLRVKHGKKLVSAARLTLCCWTKVSTVGHRVGDEAINEEMFDSVERVATTAFSLEAEQASGNINKTQFTAILNEPFSLELGSGSGPWRQETMGGMQAQTRSKAVSNLSSDPPLSGGHTLRSGEDSMEHQIELTDNVPNTPYDSPIPGVNKPRSDEGSLGLNELMDLVTKLSHRVFDLEKVKTAQTKEIAGLKRRVTKLEQRQRSRILKNHPFRFGSSRRQSLDAFDDIDDLVDEEMAFVQEKDAENQGKIGTETVSTATPRTPPTTTTIFDDEDVTLATARTLIKMKEEKAKEKGVVIKNVEDSSRPVRSITTLQPLPTIDPKDKGKGILQETESMEKTKKKVQGDAQMERDAEVALRLQVELDEELRVERERQEEASKVAKAEMFDEVQERMDADYELAARMTQKEQEKYTIEERLGYWQNSLKGERNS
ncbi:putative ribonuclease H-like domain-containing protein [Tanacetum coccineum]